MADRFNSTDVKSVKRFRRSLEKEDLNEIEIDYLMSSLKETARGLTVMKQSYDKQLTDELFKLTHVCITWINIKLEDNIYKDTKAKDIVTDTKYALLSVLRLIATDLTENEMDKYDISSDIVKALVEHLRTMIEGLTNNPTKNNTKYYVSLSDRNKCCFATDVIDDLIKIAVNDRVKMLIYNEGAMNLIEKIVINGNVDEREMCFELICLLCFQSKVIKYLKKSKEMLKLIKNESEKGSNLKTRKLCQQIIKMVCVFDPPVGHIMISYNHFSQEKCLEINNKLKKNGHKTWIDVEQAFTDLYDAMAKAIENASIVLICYTKKYKMSANCRFEAEYAVRCNKKIIAVKMEVDYEPDGWLGLILGGKLYVEFPEKETDCSVAYNNLFKQIKLSLRDLTRAINQTEKSQKNQDN